MTYEEINITNIQLNILEALATYKYLTFSQMLKLDIGTTQYQYLWKQMVNIRDCPTPLVNYHSYSVPHPRIWKSESMYYLTTNWKDFLVRELGINAKDIKHQIWNTVLHRDYYHRKKQIDFHIFLEKFLKSTSFTLDYFSAYFDKTGNSRRDNNLTSINRIELSKNSFYIPDGIFQVSDFAWESKLFLFEMCNWNDTKRIMKQVHNHAKALVSKSVHVKFDLQANKPYKILFLFDKTSIMEEVIKRFTSDQSLIELRKYFRFHDYNKIEYNDFFNTRKDVNWNSELFFSIN